tara:strand:+ start:656 stop:799 length:144 start_codon:yes stop_codon:yes gene_type:complete
VNESLLALLAAAILEHDVAEILPLAPTSHWPGLLANSTTAISGALLE